MMEEGNECKDIITQLSASRTAINRTIGGIVSTNLIECVRRAEENGESGDEYDKEAVNLLVRSS